VRGLRCRRRQTHEPDPSGAAAPILEAMAISMLRNQAVDLRA
jgi:hypothetical protein